MPSDLDRRVALSLGWHESEEYPGEWAWDTPPPNLPSTHYFNDGGYVSIGNFTPSTDLKMAWLAIEWVEAMGWRWDMDSFSGEPYVVELMGDDLLEGDKLWPVSGKVFAKGWGATIMEAISDAVARLADPLPSYPEVPSDDR